MSSDLLSIAKSGARAARIALDVTAQNISNASTEGYVRRSINLQENSGAGGLNQVGDISLYGVRVAGITRNADTFRQSEVRRTGADAARAEAELTGLENVESAVEQSNLYPAIVNFEGSLQQLAPDPVNPSLRANVIEQARTMASTFNLAAHGLDAAGTSLRTEASDGVDQVNLLAGELARVNLSLSRASDVSSDQTMLLGQRDTLLQKLSQYTDVATAIASDQTVSVRLGGNGGPLLVSGGTGATFAMTTAANGTISFTLGGNPVSLSAGSLAGKAQALVKLDDVHTRLDAVATSLMGAVNGAQASGVALDGSAGQPMFTGTGAGDIALAINDGSLIATVPAGSGANNRNSSNLDAMRTAFTSTDPPGATNALLLDISGTVAGRTVTRDALRSIADNSRVALEAQAGVDLDQEAVNLIRYQQAFQASGKAMQVASTLFDTLLQLH